MIAAIQPNIRWIFLLLAGAILSVATYLAVTWPSAPVEEQQPQSPGAARAVAVEATAEHKRTDEVRQATIAKTAIVGDGFEARLDIPDDIAAESVAITLELQPTPSSLRIPPTQQIGMQGLVSSPSRGLMGATYHNIPNALILRRLESISPQDCPQGAEAHTAKIRRAREYLDEGYQKLLSYQHQSGGFTRDSSEPAVVPTALGLLQLAELGEVMDVDAQPAMRRAAHWLAGQQQQRGHWIHDNWSADKLPVDVAQLRATAFSVWALTRASLSDEYDAVIERGSAALVQLLAAESIGPYERALAANALLAHGHRERAVAVLHTLAKQVHLDGRLRYWKQDRPTWTGNPSTYATLATTALAIRAMSRAQTHAQLIPGALAFLADKWSKWAFVRTDATIWVIEALVTVFEAGSWAPVTLTIATDGRPMSDLDSKKVEKLLIVPDRSVGVKLHAQLPSGAHTVTVEPDHPTSLVATATATYTIRAAP